MTDVARKIAKSRHRPTLHTHDSVYEREKIGVFTACLSAHEHFVDKYARNTLDEHTSGSPASAVFATVLGKEVREAHSFDGDRHDHHIGEKHSGGRHTPVDVLSDKAFAPTKVGVTTFAVDGETCLIEDTIEDKTSTSIHLGKGSPAYH